MPRECLEKKVRRKMKLGLPMVSLTMEFKFHEQTVPCLKSKVGWILYLPQVGLRERFLFEAKTKYNELRGKEAPVKLEVKKEKALEVTILRILLLPHGP